MTVEITFLGGVGEIGRNCATLESDGRIIVIDCGLMFPEEDMLGVDLVFPDWGWLQERRDDLSAVVLTHGHEDHVGALAYFLREFPIPVFGTPFSVEMARGRVEELKVEADLRALDTGVWTEYGGFKFMLVPVSHSVPQGAAVAFETKDGIILHSGDFKLDPTPIDGRPTDLPTFATLGQKGVRLLLADSTNAERTGFIPSESSLAEPIRRIVESAEGRVIAACFSSHIHRVQQIIDAGLAADRKIAIFGRSMHRNTQAGIDLGLLELPQEELLDIKDLLELPPEQQLLITTGSQGEPFAALSLIAQGQHKFVRLEAGDTVLISAQPIPGNETAVSKVISRLLRTGATVYHGRNADVHVSGHAGRDELLTFLNIVRPMAMVPVHGEYRHLHAHAQLARSMGVPWVEICEDGDRVIVDGAKTTVARRAVDAGYVYLDGSSLGDATKAVLRDRGHLADEGVVVVTVAVNTTSGEIVYGPDLDSHGMMDDPEAVLGKVADAVRSAVEEAASDGNFDLAGLQKAVRDAAARLIRAESGRRPVVLPVVLEL